jgi:hypothetical protein
VRAADNLIELLVIVGYKDFFTIGFNGCPIFIASYFYFVVAPRNGDVAAICARWLFWLIGHYRP